ncbi:unnamed protein product, partial [Nesidiocoris tenuis]
MFNFKQMLLKHALPGRWAENHRFTSIIRFRKKFHHTNHIITGATVGCNQLFPSYGRRFGSSRS